MRPVRQLAIRAAELRVPLSMVVKSELGLQVLRATAGVGGLVLQGGGAVHHVFGSPRFSADLDFAQQDGHQPEQLEAALAGAADVARQAWGSCALEPASSRGRLRRHKLRTRVDAGTTHVLAVEVYEVVAYQPLTKATVDGTALVCVESPAEIIADKLAAAVDRRMSRGIVKLRDVFDIAFLLPLGRPGPDLVRAKLMDYGYPVTLEPLRSLAAELDETAAERLRAELRDVLPRTDFERFVPIDAVRAVAALMLEIAG